MPQPRRMKNVIIFVDVDLTLIDEMGRLLPGAAEALHRLKERGCHLILWSSNGADYARDVAHRHDLADLFEAFIPKPDIVIDDMPATALNPFVLDVNEEGSWAALAEKVATQYVL